MAEPASKLRRLEPLHRDDGQDDADVEEELVQKMQEENRVLRLRIQEMEEQVAREKARTEDLQIKIVHNRALLEFLKSTVGELGHSIANFGAVHIMMNQESAE